MTREVRNGVEISYILSEKFKRGLPTESAFSAERDFFACNTMLLELACRKKGYKFENEENTVVTFADITLDVGPRITLMPDFGVTLRSISDKIIGDITLHGIRSSLVLAGTKCAIGNVEVDGALLVENEQCVDKVIKNRGWRLRGQYQSDFCITSMRGFSVSKLETEEIVAARGA